MQNLVDPSFFCTKMTGDDHGPIAGSLASAQLPLDGETAISMVAA